MHTTTDHRARGSRWAQSATRKQAERVSAIADEAVDRGEPDALGWGKALFAAVHPRRAAANGFDRATCERIAEAITGETYPTAAAVREAVDGVLDFLERDLA
jgi:hypothetical protein